MQQFSKDLTKDFSNDSFIVRLRLNVLVVSVFTICILVSNFAVAAIENNGRPCPECTDQNTPLPVLGGGGLLGLRTMLTAMSYAAVFTGPKGEELREDVTSPKDIPGVGRFALTYQLNGKSVQGEASGFLINDCLVITNKHVVEFEGNKPTSLKFQAGTSFQHEANGQVIVSGNYSTDDASTYPEDWAIVKLDKKIANQVDSIANQKIGYLETEFSSEEDLVAVDDLEVVGLIADDLDKKNGDNVNTLKRQSCASYGYLEMPRFKKASVQVNSGNIAVDCSALPGTSGSPMVRKINNKYVAVGIMRNSPNNGRASDLDSENANIFLPFIKDPSIPLSLTEAKLEAIKNDPKYKCD